MKKPNIILTVGASCSGKTTWSREFIKANPNFINLNRDDLRDNYLDTEGTYKFSKAKENLVTDLQVFMARAAVLAGKGVVISDTNLNQKTRTMWECFAQDQKLSIKYLPFYEPTHILLKRNLERTDSRPLAVIYRMAKQMREYLGKPMYDKNVEKPNQVGWRAVKPQAIVFDVDGTLAHHDNKRSPYAFKEAINDRPDEYMIDLLKMHKREGFQIIILTGRESDKSGISEVTVDWLAKHDVPYDHIWSRAHKDHRCDAIIKEELFFKHIADDFSIQCVYDDRDRVVQMWRTIGVTCHQVAEGSF